MKNKLFAAFVFTLFTLGLGFNAAWAHVTPNIKLSTTRETVARLLPAGKLFLKDVQLSKVRMEQFNGDGFWPIHENRYKFYVSRGENNQLQRAMVSITEMSRHGPLVVAVAFLPDGTVAEAMITDIQMEPLTWVSPLLKANYMAVFRGKDSGMKVALDPKWAKGATTMTQTYALLIAHAVKKAAVLFDETFQKNPVGL